MPIPRCEKMSAISLISSPNTHDASQNPLLPVTVQDQIRLWELERNRLKSSEGPTLLLFGQWT